MHEFKIGYFNDDLYIILLLNSKCNYRCSYCCTTEIKSHMDSLNANKSELSIKEIDYVLDNLTNNNIRLLIMGGEPTLSKNLNYLLDKAFTKPNIKTIEILTNGSIPLTKFNINPKTLIVFTYHPYKNHQRNLIENIKFCIKHNIEYEFNLMFPQDKHYPNIDRLLKILKILNVTVIPIYPYIDSKEFEFKQPPYKEEFLRCFNLDAKWYSLREVYEQHLNKFKGWTCYNAMFIIDMDLNIRQCSGEVLGHLKGFNFNHYIQKCELESCVYEGFLRSLKVCHD